MPAQPSAVGGAEKATQVAADEIARRVADLVVERIREPFRLVDTQTLARMLAVSEEWVRAHGVRPVHEAQPDRRGGRLAAQTLSGRARGARPTPVVWTHEWPTRLSRFRG